VKADAGGSAAPAVVMTMYVFVVAPHVAVKPATLFLFTKFLVRVL
jgi:hypothetical protein